ncbi:MAG: GNAT family N-acetyltransferase [Actinomycetota bacterium]|nr:GNAT family N-acetyltransferase [Actinomycetota bacterium]
MSQQELLLRTERLGLRPFRVGDLDDLESMLGDAETMKYYPNPFTREMCSSWIEDNRRRYEEDGFGLWVIEELITGEFLGDCGPAKRFVEGVWMVELGWHVKRSCWRQGIASEAALACKGHAFRNLGVPKLVSMIRPVNIPSKGVASKIGMSIEREVRYKNYRHLLYSVGREPDA